jgi:hypothetical protein
MPPGRVVPGLVFGVILALLLVAALIRARREED